MPHLELSPRAIKCAYPGPAERESALGLASDGDPEMLDALPFSRTCERLNGAVHRVAVSACASAIARAAAASLLNPRTVARLY